MTKPTRLTTEQAIDAGISEFYGMEGMVAELSRLNTESLERLFRIGVDRVAELPRGTEAADKTAAMLECISIVFVNRAEAGEVSPDHPILEVRRQIYARVAEKEGRA